MKRIVVTQAVIDQCIAARKGWYNPCPVTIVLRQRFPHAYVLANGCGIHAGKHFRTSPEVAAFMTDWDHQKPVQPISFWLFQKNRPWKRLAIWFNKLPQIKAAKNRYWYPLMDLTRNIWPVRMCRVTKRKIDRYEQIKQRALIPLQAGGQYPQRLKLSTPPR